MIPHFAKCQAPAKRLQQPRPLTRQKPGAAQASWQLPPRRRPRPCPLSTLPGLASARSREPFLPLARRGKVEAAQRQRPRWAPPPESLSAARICRLKTSLRRPESPFQSVTLTLHFVKPVPFPPCPSDSDFPGTGAGQCGPGTRPHRMRISCVRVYMCACVCVRVRTHVCWGRGLLAEKR